MKMNLSQAPQGDLSAFAGMLGGMEGMANRFPRTYQAYQSTIMGRDMLLATGKNTSYDIEITHVGYSDASKQSIVVELEASVRKEDGYCVLTADARHRDGRPLTKTMEENFLGDTQHLSLKIPADNIRLEDIRIHPTLYKVDDSIKRYGAEDPGAEEYSINLSGYMLDPVCEFTICDPRIKHTSLTNKNINVAYRVQSIAPDCTDYFYPAINFNFHLPSKGSIRVSGVNVGDVCQCTLKAGTKYNTERWHCSPKAECKTSGLIEWEIPEDWGFTYWDLLKEVSMQITYTLTIQVVIQGIRATFVVTNSSGHPSINRKEIPAIVINRDCFVNGTQITMADGSERPIENLCSGDWVRTEQGRARVLEVLYGGEERNLAHIETEDGLELFVTTNHPLETPEGLRCAAFLRAGDRVKTMRGESRVKWVCVGWENKGLLCDVRLEDDHRVYANGILAGDSDAEMTEAEKAFNLRYQVPEAWRDDYDSWITRHEGI